MVQSSEMGTALKEHLESPAVRAISRPSVRGKFLFLGEEKFYVRGVTYGTFRPDANGNEYHNLKLIDQDFAKMAANGINTIRIYNVPPPRVLDMAQKHGLRVMVGLSAEQYVGFLIDKKKSAPNIQELVRAKVRACAGHPSLLCYALGNEIPAPIARWLGRRQVERYLAQLYRVVKAEDPDGLVTYVNYPTTEYLQLPFLDFVCFNVYLESQERFEAYLARLHILAGDRPLIMSEVGLDSLRNGRFNQARVLDWQVRSSFGSGCAGVFVYAWTDEWYRGGADAYDWAFGLTDAGRNPKPALASVRKAFSEIPFPSNLNWPRISVVVCSHNGARTIRDCCEGLLKLEYPNYEVIVVDDGSTDRTAALACRYGFRVISTENRGLSNARNTGMEAATGEIVAYIDDDAYPDPHWLTYLAFTFLSTSHAGVGGPNIAPPGDGPVAECVDHAPGNPTHVLLSDREAEHIPGCNMAFRKASLQAIGGFEPRLRIAGDLKRPHVELHPYSGFDPQFRVAGDDVDVCWRLQQQGETLGFSPAAMVWHHRRNSIRTYWKQQLGYGKAEAMLERKWPQRYNAVGHFTWAGRVYAKGLMYLLGCGGRIYHGIWGSAPFQSLYQPGTSGLWSLPSMPEWYLATLFLVGLTALGALWRPLLFASPLLILAVVAPLVQAGVSAARTPLRSVHRRGIVSLKFRALIAFLCLLQPLGRLWGRLRHGLCPWRRRGPVCRSLPRPQTFSLWTERWQSPDERLESLEAALRARDAVVRRGGDFDRWDLEVRSGLFGAGRILMAVEDHGCGRQLVRYRSWPRYSPAALVPTLLFAALSSKAALDHAWLVCTLLGLTALLQSPHGPESGCLAMAAVRDALILSCIRAETDFEVEPSQKSDLIDATQYQTAPD